MPKVKTKSRSYVSGSYINFVSAKTSEHGENEDSLEEKKPNQNTTISRADGTEIKQFYEDLVNSSGLSDSNGQSTSSDSCHIRNPVKTSDKSEQSCNQCEADGQRIRGHVNLKEKQLFGEQEQIRENSKSKHRDLRVSDLRPGTKDEQNDVQRQNVECGEGQRSRENIREIRKCSDFLRSAQNGDLKSIKHSLENSKLDINAQDGFGWSALMCASHSGHLAVCQYLVESGADVHLRDSQGKSAEELAGISGHRHVVKLLQAVMNGLYEDYVNSLSGTSVDNKGLQKFYCEICKRHYEETTRKQHETSTVHIFNKGHRKLSTSYFLSESNKGYQLMLKSGWDKEQGLGPEGHGQKYPVKTVLKQDRTGLGIKSDSRAKVTHFSAYDADAIKHKTDKNERKMRIGTLNKRELKRKHKKEVAFEKNIRLQFNME